MSAVDREKVSEFVAITGAPVSLAESLLTACDGSLEMAVNMHMEEVEERQARDPGANSPREDLDDVAAAGSSSSSSRPRAVGRRRNKGNAGDPGQGSSRSAAGEGSSSNGSGGEDDVRAPIPQRQETMIEAGYEGYHIRPNERNSRRGRVRTVFDGFRDFGNEANSYGRDGELPVDRGKKRTLAELFKPPIDVTYKGEWQSARDAAESAKKWLLVNIQDAGEFQCQVLNRDVWSNEAVKTVLKEHFIFWQQYKESEDAQRYMTFYPVTEWPHVSILDPRTGEQLVTWNKIPDANCFCELVTEFLTLNPSLENAANGPPTKKKAKKESILDADEDDQLAAAIQASLADSQPSSSSSSAQTSSNKKEGSNGRVCTLVDSDDSEFEPYSGEESNLSVPTPVKQRSKANSRAVSPEPSKNGKQEPNGEQQPPSNNGTSTSPAKTTEVEDYRMHLGPDSDDPSSIMIRLPDGRRQSQDFPCSSKFRALTLYLASQGFPADRFEAVTNFPRRVFDAGADGEKTLKDLGLFPRETVFVQEKAK